MKFSLDKNDRATTWKGWLLMLALNFVVWTLMDIFRSWFVDVPISYKFSLITGFITGLIWTLLYHTNYRAILNKRTGDQEQ